MCVTNKGQTKAWVIESTVVLVSGASLALIKQRSSLNGAVSLDQTNVLPWQQGSPGLRCLLEDVSWEEDRTAEGENGIYIQQSAGSRSCTNTSD